jgi:hypothetical protein
LEGSPKGRTKTLESTLCANFLPVLKKIHTSPIAWDSAHKKPESDEDSGWKIERKMKGNYS